MGYLTAILFEGMLFPLYLSEESQILIKKGLYAWQPLEAELPHLHAKVIQTPRVLVISQSFHRQQMPLSMRWGPAPKLTAECELLSAWSESVTRWAGRWSIQSFGTFVKTNTKMNGVWLQKGDYLKNGKIGKRNVNITGKRVKIFIWCENRSNMSC